VLCDLSLLEVAHRHHPLSAFGLPLRPNNLVLKLDVSVQVVAMAEVCEILADFIGSRIVGGPPRVRLEGPGVASSGSTRAEDLGRGGSLTV
jgi:hypothetical protein